MTEQNANVNEQVNDQAQTIDTAAHVPAVIEQDPMTLMEAFKTGNTAFYSSIINDGNRTTQVKMFNAISDALQLSDNINVPICVSDFMAHPVQLVDEETGEVVNAIRVILVTDQGVSYAAVSNGVQNALERMVGIFGPAPWQPGLWMVAQQMKVRSSNVNKVMTIKLLTDEEVAALGKK